MYTISDSVWLWFFSAAVLKCDIKMNCSLNNNSSIQFADHENIIMDTNIIQIQLHVANKTSSGFGRHLEFMGKGITGQG